MRQAGLIGAEILPGHGYRGVVSVVVHYAQV
jgi:hypothetical protein